MPQLEPQSSNTRGAWTVALLVAALVAYPPLYVLHAGGESAGFAFVFGDAFLYLTIARNSTLGHFTFDGSTITNGFHPLWQWLMTVVFQGEPPSTAPDQTRWVVLISLVCVAIGLVCTSLAIHRFTRSRLLAMLAVPGVFYLLAGAIIDCHPAWDDVSGMENGVSVLFGGIVLWVLSLHLTKGDHSLEELVRERGLASLYTRLGLVLPLLVLSRLDDVFVLGTFGITVLVARVSWPERIRAGLRVGLPSLVAILAYMLHNKATAGTFLPISGMTKAGVVLGKNLYMTAAGAVPPLVDFKNAVSAKQSDLAALQDNLFRGVEILVPMLLCAIFVLVDRKGTSGSGRRWFLAALAGHVWVKGIYNMLNVHLFHQSTWYFAFNLLIVTLLGVLLVAPAYRTACTTRLAKRSLAACYATVVILSSSEYIRAKLGDRNPEFDYWKAREEISTGLAAVVEDPRLIAFDDGITGYAMPFPTMHGFVFAGDLATAQARLRGELLRHAYARGHRVITGSSYLPMTETLGTSEEIRSYLGASILEELVKQELDQLDFRVAYLHESTGTPFIEFWPRNASPIAGR